VVFRSLFPSRRILKGKGKKERVLLVYFKTRNRVVVGKLLEGMLAKGKI